MTPGRLYCAVMSCIDASLSGGDVEPPVTVKRTPSMMHAEAVLSVYVTCSPVMIGAMSMLMTREELPTSVTTNSFAMPRLTKSRKFPAMTAMQPSVQMCAHVRVCVFALFSCCGSAACVFSACVVAAPEAVSHGLEDA
eukprot:391295-Rhodomonas_salina.3